MRPGKRILYEKLRSWCFTVYLRIWKLFPCRGKLLSHILVQFAHELSTTMFVLIKKDYRKKIGRRNRSPRITVYILRHATHAVSFTLSLFSCCSSNLSLIQLIGSTNLHPNNTQTQRISMVDRKSRAHLHYIQHFEPSFSKSNISEQRVMITLSCVRCCQLLLCLC